MQAGAAGESAGAGTHSWTDLVDAATALASTSNRCILGITGPPGAGKSVLAQRLADLLTLRGHPVALAGMDGFHLANAELARLGRTERKGAPDTFDGSGYVALLGRLRAAGGDVVYAPLFDRSIEEPIAGAVPIAGDVTLVITEGNYLLHPDGPWSAVRGLLDECWYLELDERLRVERLIGRHMRFGRTRKEAVERAQASDMRNARLIARSRSLASRVVTPPDLAP